MIKIKTKIATISNIENPLCFLTTIVVPVDGTTVDDTTVDGTTVDGVSAYLNLSDLKESEAKALTDDWVMSSSFPILPLFKPPENKLTNFSFL